MKMAVDPPQTTPEPGDAYVAAEALMPIDWRAGGRVHNWRTHVGEHVRALWEEFTEAQKVAIAWDADWLASSELWE